MKQQLISLIQQAIESLQNSGDLNADIQANIQIETTKNPQHGEFASNIALMLNKQAGMPPRDLAQLICSNLPSSDIVEKTEIAGPGFINFFISADSQQSIIKSILTQQESFGLAKEASGLSYQVEFVSANPTGPLHVGHGRGAAYGASIANLYEACGHKVQREYYVNDAGRQMNILGTSVWLRYLQQNGIEFDFPSNGYRGEYIIDYGKALQQKYGAQFVQPKDDVFNNVFADASEDGQGDKEKHIDDLIRNAQQLLGDNYAIVFEYGLNEVLNDIREDLINFGVHFDQWFSEKSLTHYGDKHLDLIAQVIEQLQAKNLIEEREGALWFLSTQFGDDKDRVIKRSNGDYTYFASDIAYHYEKVQRGFDKIVNVWGADHHGYIARVKAAMQALDIDPEKIIIKMVQLVSLYRGEEPAQMSTRSGEFIELKTLYDEVGKDAARFFYVMRKVEQPTDFDLELAKSQSQENPVYYVQYAHARVSRLFERLQEEGIAYSSEEAISHLNLLTEEKEQALMKKLSAYPQTISKAGNNGEPHVLVNYLRELAADFHSYYNDVKVITDDKTLSIARSALCQAAQQTLKNGLSLLNISAPNKM